MTILDNLKYTEDHEWVRLEDDGIAVVGITDFAQDALGDITYVEVDTVGETLDKAEQFGSVEAVKTTSELFMPVSGEVIEFNDELNEDEGDNPEILNTAPYDAGWIIKIKMSDPTELDGLLSAAAYGELTANG